MRRNDGDEQYGKVVSVSATGIMVDDRHNAEGRRARVEFASCESGWEPRVGDRCLVVWQRTHGGAGPVIVHAMKEPD
jgi:hypothetical protein